MSARAIRIKAGSVAVEPFPWTRVPAGRSPAGQAPDRAADAAVTAAAAERVAAMERDAFVKGYAQGERAGTEAAAREGEAMLRRLAEAIDETASLRSELLKRSERDLVQLAVAVAERVVRRELSLDRTLIVAMAKVAIEQLAERGTATIRLNPVDHAACAAVSNGLPLPARVELVADPMVTRSGCIVQTDFGSMDLDANAQLTEISRALLGSDDPAGTAADTNGIADA